MHVLGMPPAFVLSQDQTLKFALGKSLNSPKLRALSHASLLKDMHATSALSAPPPAHPFHTNNVNEQPRQVTPAGGGLISLVGEAVKR